MSGRPRLALVRPLTSWRQAPRHERHDTPRHLAPQDLPGVPSLTASSLRPNTSRLGCAPTSRSPRWPRRAVASPGVRVPRHTRSRSTGNSRRSRRDDRSPPPRCSGSSAWASARAVEPRGQTPCWEDAVADNAVRKVSVLAAASASRRLVSFAIDTLAPSIRPRRFILPGAWISPSAAIWTLPWSWA
jgi:hypothetical protein